MILPMPVVERAYWDRARQRSRMQIRISAYVQQADGSTVQVAVLDAGVLAALHALGFQGQAPTLRAEVGDDISKARLFAALRDLGVAFAAGREWSPVEVFGWLCDHGLLEGPYLRIAWTDPQRYVVCSVMALSQAQTASTAN